MTATQLFAFCPQPFSSMLFLADVFFFSTVASTPKMQHNAPFCPFLLTINTHIFLLHELVTILINTYYFYATILDKTSWHIRISRIFHEWLDLQAG